jgi:hypothetical protein
MANGNAPPRARVNKILSMIKTAKLSKKVPTRAQETEYERNNAPEDILTKGKTIVHNTIK